MKPASTGKHPEQGMGLFTRLSLSLFFLSGAVFAQLPFSIGVKAGVPVTDAITNSQITGGAAFYSDSKNYIVGPMVELRLPFHFAVEADALYRPLNVTSNSVTIPSGTAITTISGQTSSNYSTWEFPILAKYRFSFPIVKPYIEAGPSFRTRSQSINYFSNKGVTVGAGLDVHALLIHIAPEFRYTHWANDTQIPQFTAPFQSKQDQVEFLVGFSF